MNEPSIQSEIQSITSSKRIDLNLWQEGGYPFLTINLIEPKQTDTTSLKNLEEITKNRLLTKYQFKVIYIESVTDEDKNRLVKIELE